MFLEEKPASAWARWDLQQVPRRRQHISRRRLVLSAWNRWVWHTNTAQAAVSLHVMFSCVKLKKNPETDRFPHFRTMFLFPLWCRPSCSAHLKVTVWRSDGCVCSSWNGQMCHRDIYAVSLKVFFLVCLDFLFFPSILDYPAPSRCFFLLLFDTDRFLLLLVIIFSLFQISDALFDLFQ